MTISHYALSVLLGCSSIGALAAGAAHAGQQGLNDHQEVNIRKNCSICLELITQNAQADFTCAHAMHINCLADYVNAGTIGNHENFQCPECRVRPLTISDPIRYRDAYDRTLVFVHTGAELDSDDDDNLAHNIEVLRKSAQLKIDQDTIPEAQRVPRPALVNARRQEIVVADRDNALPEDAIFNLNRADAAQNFDFQEAYNAIQELKNIRDAHEIFENSVGGFVCGFRGQQIEAPTMVDLIRRALDVARNHHVPQDVFNNQINNNVPENPYGGQPVPVPVQPQPIHQVPNNNVFVIPNQPRANPESQKSGYTLGRVSGDLLAGVVFGSLIGPELSDYEESPRATLVRRGALIPATIGTHLLVNNMCPQKENVTFTTKALWIAGAVGGIALQHFIRKNARGMSRPTAFDTKSFLAIK